MDSLKLQTLNHIFPWNKNKKERASLVFVSSSHLILLENKNVCMTFLCYCFCKNTRKSGRQMSCNFFFGSTTPNAFQLSSHRISPFERDDSKVCVCVYYHECRGLSYIGFALGVNTLVAKDTKETDLTWGNIQKVTTLSGSGAYAETSCSHPLIAWLYR